MPDFYHPDILVTWQQSAPESGKLKWVDNGCKLHKQLSLWETQPSHFILLGSWESPIFQFFCIPAFSIGQLSWTSCHCHLVWVVNTFQMD